MKPTSRILTPALAALVLFSLIVVVSPPLAPASAAPNGFAEPALHRLHGGYDKATGQQAADPLVDAAAFALAVSKAETLMVRKAQQVDPTRITFRSGITVHPEPGMAVGVRDGIARDAASGRLWLIQFCYPFPTEARSRLQGAGVRFYDYVDVGGLYARVPPKALPLLEEMLQEGVLRYVGRIPAEAKMDRALAEGAARYPSMEREIVVMTFGEPAEAEMDEMGQWMTVEGRSSGPIPFVTGRALGASIRALAELEIVRWVEPQSQPELANLEGGMGVGADVVRAEGFDGTGVQVMVVDSGIAREGDTYHPDLQSDRILDQWDYQNDDAIAADDYYLGHGTHVAGTIGGRTNPGDSHSDPSYQGVAPGSDFLIYKLCCGTGQLSALWFQAALERATSGGNAAHVSNNSWGGGTYGGYAVTSEIADAAVRGQFNGKPVNVVAAAMNENYLVRSPGTGKNVITVGAVKDGNYPDATLPYLGTCTDDDWPPGERLCYSNYGPIDTDGTDDPEVPDGDGQERVKPDLVAPGALITSAVPWYLIRYDGEYYGSLHGTSMATPHVTGAIAQLLDAYSEVSGGWLFDWPEMVKAMLLATAVDIGADGQGGETYYGHGLLDVYHTIYAQSGVDEPMELWTGSVSATGETRDFTFDVPTGYQEVRVVLTWADPPGATEAINDLDVLWVLDGEGGLRGNAGSFDDTVEYARIQAGYTPGTWRIRVRATSVVSPTQRFALAAHVILADTDLSIRATPSSSREEEPTFGMGGEFYLHQYVSNSGYTAGGSYARLQVPDGFTVRGATLFTQDGREHWYGAGELYHPAATPNDWYMAAGETLAGFERHVRWTIGIDEGTVCGTYLFASTAYWREGGVQQASSTVVTPVPVTCHAVYLPLVLRGK
ncbi:MAG: S8 family peptidase [Anaerolineae bacterium]